MNLINKFVIGLAQSDPKYGLNKNNKLDEVFDKLKNYNLNFLIQLRSTRIVIILSVKVKIM